MQARVTHSDAGLIALAQVCAAAAAILTSLVGALVLLGWAFNLSFLESPLPGQVSMKPLTAAGLVLGGLALWLLRDTTSTWRGPLGWRSRVGLICAGLVAVVGGLTLLEYALRLDFGFDRLLFGQALLSEGIVPLGRPAPATSLCLLLLGLGLLTIDAKPAWLAPAATLLALLVGGLAIMGYAYAVTTLYQFGTLIAVAPHTALAIVILGLGVLAARPQGPIPGVLTTNLAGSQVGRRLLPVVVVAPFILGLLWLYGQRLGLYDTGFGVSLLVTSNAVVLASVVYASAHLLNRTDARRVAAYQAQRLTEENLRLMLDSIKDHAIFMLDTDGRVASWNAAAERIQGYSAAEIIGQPVSVFYPPEEAAGGKPQKQLQIAVANGSSEEEGLRVRKDGSRFWAIADTAALRDEQGVLRGYSKVTRDITERKQAELDLREREERLRVLADATPNGLMIVADSGQVTWANQRAEVLFGFNGGQLLGRSIDELVPRRYQNGHMTHRADFAEHRQARLMGAGRDLFGQRQDGSEFPVEIGLSPVETSQGKLTLASIIDITERKRAEDEIRRSEQRLVWTLQAGRAGVWDWDLASGVARWSPEMYELWGVTPGTPMETENWLALVDDRDRETVNEQIAAGIANHNDAHYEFRIHHPRAGERWMETYLRATYGTDGQAVSMLGMTMDISERKQAEEALRRLNADLEARVAQRTAALAASEVKFRTMFNVLPVGVSILDEERRVVDSNPALTRILKMPFADLAADAQAQRKFINPDGTPLAPADYPSARVLRELRPGDHVEMGVVTETGETLWIDGSGAPLPLPGYSAVIVTVDLTERKRMEADLRQSEERFAQAFRFSPIALAITRSTDATFIDVNEGFLALFGYPREEVIGQRATDLNVITDLDERAAMARQFREQGCVHNYETVRRTKSGELRHVLLSADPLELNGEAHILTTMLDITARKNAEAALRESEDKFSKAFHASGAGIVISRAADGLILEANDSYVRLVGYERDEIIGRTTQEIRSISPGDRARLLAAERAQGHVHNMEINYFTKTGAARTALTSTEPIVIGAEDCLLSVLYDITERKEIQQALSTERDQLQALLDNVPDTIYFKDRASRFTRINLAQARWLGVASPELAVGKTDADFQPEPLAAELYAEEQALLQTGQPLIDRLEFNPTPAGEPRWLSSTKVPLKDAAGEVVGLVGISRDISARVKADEVLRRLNQQLADRVNELSLLNKLDEQLQACLTLEETYALSAQIMGQLAPAHPGALYIVAPDRREVASVAIWGRPAPASLAFGFEDCWALRRGQLHLVDGSHTGLSCRHVAAAQPSASLCMPLVVQGQTLGLLHLFAPEAAGAPLIDDSLLQLVRVVGDSLALTWANLTLRESLRQQAIRDPLTGLFNRRFMEESLARELHRAARNHQSVGMIMLDIDRFKDINDTFGHEAGDAVLRGIGRLLHNHSRGSDIPCRYGGEEFLLILPEASLETAEQRAEQIRRTFGEMEFAASGETLRGVTVSAGVAAYPQHGEVLEAVVRAADAALYQAKRAGRNRMSVAAE